VLWPLIGQFRYAWPLWLRSGAESSDAGTPALEEGRACSGATALRVAEGREARRAGRRPPPIQLCHGTGKTKGAHAGLGLCISKLLWLLLWQLLLWLSLWWLLLWLPPP
jgi:hypothetical protein